MTSLRIIGWWLGGLLIFLRFTLGAQSCSDPSHVLVQRKDSLPVSNGCSKPEGISVGGEEDFTYCCDRHDACYSTCGISKDYCEQDFGRCLEQLCKTTFTSNRQCSSAAQMYQLGTTMFGGNGFQGLQNDFCVCLPQSKVTEHYTQLLTQLYRDHSDKSDVEIHEFTTRLMTKAGTSIRKLGKVFNNMIKKYDTAIQHEGKRVGANPPQPKRKRTQPKQEL
jgi:secretory phospholipase A2